MKKVFYFDVETTGLNPSIHDITNLAYIVEINGEVKERGLINSQPFDWSAISSDALQISGHTIEDLKEYQKPKSAYIQLIDILAKYCDKYNRIDKFYPAGFNARFDMDFLHQFFVKNGDQYFGSFFNWHIIDPRPILIFLNYTGEIDLPKYNLEESCKLFSIPLTAHNPESDIEATRELLHKLTKRISYTEENGK